MKRYTCSFVLHIDSCIKASLLSEAFCSLCTIVPCGANDAPQSPCNKLDGGRPSTAFISPPTLHHNVSFSTSSFLVTPTFSPLPLEFFLALPLVVSLVESGSDFTWFAGLLCVKLFCCRVNPLHCCFSVVVSCFYADSVTFVAS